MNQENNYFHILGNTPRKSKFDPDLAERMNEEEERLERMEELKRKREELKARKKGKIKPKVQEQQTTNNQPLTNINLSEYIIIPNTDLLIADYEPDFTKGFKWLPNNPAELQSKGVFYQLSQRGLRMPTPAQFMPFFKNVVDAFNDKIKLYYANGNELNKQQIEDLYKHLTTAHINGGVWSWLNARFVEGTGFNNLDLETVVNVNLDGTLATNKEPLLEYVSDNCFVELEFNRQGLPTKKSKIQKYKQGENIYFYAPLKDYVARFDANSGRACLDCYRRPDLLGASFGVSCVVTTSDKSTGGTQ